MNNATDKWINIHSFADLQSAYIIKGALEAEGIPALIPSDTMSTVYPTTLSWSAIDLYVPERFQQQAEEILRRQLQ
ncbi:MAG: DUF2007 domain-containing protein [Muribaculaceae bacterium]|nr:DUF2007 domain-containing protein [Muribaculaceae bacterium]